MTTLRQPTAEIGAAALAAMLDRVVRADLPTRDILLHGELVVRESCGPHVTVVNMTRLAVPGLFPTVLTITACLTVAWAEATCLPGCSICDVVTKKRRAHNAARRCRELDGTATAVSAGKADVFTEFLNAAPAGSVDFVMRVRF